MESIKIPSLKDTVSSPFNLQNPVTFELKFSLGQEIFYLEKNKIQTGTIFQIKISINTFQKNPNCEYTISGRSEFNSEGLNLFATKEDLIKSLD